MSCVAAVGLHYAQNCTIFDATVAVVFSTVAVVLVLMTLSHVTVAAVFSPDSTNTRYGSSPAYAGLPHTNEYLREHEMLTFDLFSP